MTDDRFEDFLRSAVHDLDPVPEVPREEMWARIEQARRFQPQVRRPARPVWQRWSGWAVGAAALLMVGFGIGRLTGALQQAEPAPIASNTDTPRDDAAAGDASAVTTADEPARLVIEESPPEERRQPRLESPSRRLQSATDAAATPYRLAALRHLSRAEGLLTSVAVGEVDEQVTNWASEMLTTTRLMLDSPATDDPRMARLLEDLELILAQIVNTTEDRKDADLRWIQQGLETNNVLPRLRNALPADRGVIGT